MSVRRWALIVLLLGALCVLGFGVLRRPSPADNRRKLVIWGVNLGPDSKGTQAVIRAFEAKHPDVNVKVVAMGAGNMDPQKLMTSIVGNVAPDVILQDRVSLPDWASRGAFRSLDDLIARDREGDPLCPKREEYYPAAWAESSYGGKLYGIPMALDTRVLYWNKDRFRERALELRAAGLDPNRAPKTWSELLAYSKALTEYNPDGSIKRAGFIPNVGNSWLYLFAFQMNAAFMSPDGKRCTMASPETERALTFMTDGYDFLGGYEKVLAFQSGMQVKENDPFLVGQVAMKIDGDWVLPDMARYGPHTNIGAAPPPSPDDRLKKQGAFKNEKEPYITWSGGHCLAIPTGARNVQDAWEYLKFASSMEGRWIETHSQRDWERLRGRTFIAKQVANRLQNEALQKEFKPADPRFAAAMAMNVAMASHSRMRPSTIVGQVLWTQHIKAMEASFYHRATPMKALQTSQANVQKELDALASKGTHPHVDTRLPALAGIALLLVGLGGWTFAWSRSRLGRLSKNEGRWALLFIAPCIVGYIILTLGPMVASFFFSFTQYDVLSQPRWVGLQNYTDIWTSDKANTTRALGNAAYMAAVGVPLSLITGLAVALLLNLATRGMRVYRTLFYMPAIVPAVASAILWVWVLTPDPGKGLINSGWSHTLSKWLGAPAPPWLGSASWSKDALILMGLWGVGSGMILWLAGLKGVPQSLYEAASLDGANPVKQFWKVTVPMLSPLIFFNAVMGFIGAMQEFDRMYIMRPSVDGAIGPDDSLLTPVFLLFQNGFAFFKMGYASSLAWAIFAIIVLLTVVQFWLAPRWVHYEVDR
ncbi:MAG: multiple sugar transport system permease protein [Fimbriimonadaceae bacterium]|jgi:multiple sugar transport system permease protein|nr:multiple sugar transport system permease protein [Fimbriimonadaceae bacterium]